MQTLVHSLDYLTFSVSKPYTRNYMIFCSVSYLGFSFAFVSLDTNQGTKSSEHSARSELCVSLQAGAKKPFPIPYYVTFKKGK